GTSTQTIPHRTPAERYRLSFAQQRLWFLDQLEPNNPAYNVPIALRLRGPLDAPALERALTELIARHESLRTSFASGEGDPVQIIHPPQPFHLAVDSIEAEHISDARLVELAAIEARLPFDLASGSLLRARLIRLSDTDHVVLVTIHHIVFDGWSAGIFIRELALLYHAFARGEASPLPKLAIQYADFAEWQRGWLTGETLQTQLDFWKDHLGQEHPLLELPTDFPRPALKRFQGATETIQLSRELLTRLKQLASETDATLFMTLLAAFQTLLFRYTGQTDIRVGTPISGRTSAETKNIIGLFANTLVLRAELSEKPTFRQLLAKVRQTTLDAFAHQDLPFEKLVEELQPERDLSRTALFQTLFVFKPVPKDWQPGGQLKFEHIQSNRGAAKFDLTLTISERPHEFLAAFEYDTDLFTADTIRRMLNHFQNLLGAMVANPDQVISRLMMLSPAELNQLTEDWNQTAVAFPPDECLHQLFEAQAAQYPDRLAVVAGDDQITFAELNARADALAAHLQHLGVGPEVFVGLAIDRSVEMFVGLLGILKAGGAYVPIDPAFPAERIQFILADTQAPVVVTQSHLLDRVSGRSNPSPKPDEVAAPLQVPSSIPRPLSPIF
ncbi:MAG TPA: condensation domain-containing protein, partial [Acidobacteriota bacterium]|nr:condensation domain-containing protein [Acidobacteriota bacterium]